MDGVRSGRDEAVACTDDLSVGLPAPRRGDVTTPAVTATRDGADRGALVRDNAGRAPTTQICTHEAGRVPCAARTPGTRARVDRAHRLATW